MPEAWSESEVRHVVADYFAMLRSELFGQPFSKAQHRRQLLPLLSGRREQSIEFKHCNISAILLELHLPYIDGYKPRSNYQARLKSDVQAFLIANPTFFSELLASPILDPATPGPSPLPPSSLFVPPPDSGLLLPRPTDRQPSPAPAVDFALRDAQNRRLGELGERWVLDLERRRLQDSGRPDLATRIDWVSRSQGDGLGFDILSFNPDASELWIEVKTTSLGKYFPFYLTQNEVRVSDTTPDRYHLYRVFDFARSPRVFTLPGSLSQSCLLEPALYRATRRPSPPPPKQGVSPLFRGCHSPYLKPSPRPPTPSPPHPPQPRQSHPHHRPARHRNAHRPV